MNKLQPVCLISCMDRWKTGITGSKPARSCIAA